MGMGNRPCSGYVLPATEKVFKKLNADLGEFEEDWKEYQKDFPKETFDTFLDWVNVEYGNNDVVFNAVPDSALGASISISLYRYSRDEGDRYDDLEDGLYFIFDEDTLYIRELTPVGKALKRKKILPELQVWTVFG